MSKFKGKCNQGNYCGVKQHNKGTKCPHSKLQATNRRQHLGFIKKMRSDGRVVFEYQGKHYSSITQIKGILRTQGIEKIKIDSKRTSRLESPTWRVSGFQ